MSIAEEISKLQTNINEAYSSIGNKGGTVPEHKTAHGLAGAVNSIPAGGGSLPLVESRRMQWSSTTDGSYYPSEPQDMSLPAGCSLTSITAPTQPIVCLASVRKEATLTKVTPVGAAVSTTGTNNWLWKWSIPSNHAWHYTINGAETSIPSGLPTGLVLIASYGSSYNPYYLQFSQGGYAQTETLDSIIGQVSWQTYNYSGSFTQGQGAKLFIAEISNEAFDTLQTRYSAPAVSCFNGTIGSGFLREDGTNIVFTRTTITSDSMANQDPFHLSNQNSLFQSCLYSKNYFGGLRDAHPGWSLVKIQGFWGGASSKTYADLSNVTLEVGKSYLYIVGEPIAEITDISAFWDYVKTARYYTMTTTQAAEINNLATTSLTTVITNVNTAVMDNPHHFVMGSSNLYQWLPMMNLVSDYTPPAGTKVKMVYLGQYETDPETGEQIQTGQKYPVLFSENDITPGTSYINDGYM